MRSAYTFRAAQGVWINDVRSTSLPRQQWPCVLLDERAERDLCTALEAMAKTGFSSLSVFGLLTAGAWDPRLPRTVDRQRRRRIGAILRAARRCGIGILYGLGVYSWGFDRIIAEDPAVQGTNPHAMCASRDRSQRWMRAS